MVQIVSVAVAVLGLIFGVVKEYQSGNIKLPQITYTSQNVETAKPVPVVYPKQFCLMCYDPNTDRVWYQHEDGSWRDTPPLQKKIGTYYY